MASREFLIDRFGATSDPASWASAYESLAASINRPAETAYRTPRCHQCRCIPRKTGHAAIEQTATNSVAVMSFDMCRRLHIAEIFNCTAVGEAENPNSGQVAMCTGVRREHCFDSAGIFQRPEC